MHKILVIEDQEDLRELIAYNLGKENKYEVVEAENANDALILIEDISFDLILLDLMLPGLKGFEFLKIVKKDQSNCDVPVIIVSAKSSDKDIVQGLELGAEDYLTKPFSFNVLITKIEKILNRVLGKSLNRIKYKDIEINVDQYEAFIDGKELRLTHKEFELLLLFIKRPKTVFHRNQLLNTVWGYESDVYTRTIDAHVSSLRKKMGSYGKLIKSVPKVGYGFDL